MSALLSALLLFYALNAVVCSVTVSEGRPGFCSEECYQRATCNEEVGGRCDCPKHLAGRNCYRNATASHLFLYGQSADREARQPMPCLNKCTQRGRCRLGSCICRRGFFGSDCSLSLEPSGRPVLLNGSNYRPRERRPWIYVYDIPHKYSSWFNPLRIDRGLHWVFWERLLGSGALVADGDQADWYFIPIKLRGTSDGYRLMEAVDYVRNTWPWYNKLLGYRHFIIHSGDTGRGEVVDHVRTITANVTWLHHWGLTEEQREPGWRAAHRPGRDVVIPIFMAAKPVGNTGSQLSMSGLHPRGPRWPRNHTLLFAGRICGDHKPPDPTKSWPHCVTDRSPGYSQGVRQMVHFHHHRRAGYKLVTSDPDYVADLLTYKWCLAPSGGGHGHRQVLAASMGCLPLVISDAVLQPFEPEMDWSAFSLRLPHAAIPTLHTALAAINDSMLEDMQAALMCAAQHLVYSGSGGAFMQEDGRFDAFEMILEILRMQQMYPGLDPALYTQQDERFRYFVNCGDVSMQAYGKKLRQAHLARYPAVPTVPVHWNTTGADKSRRREISMEDLHSDTLPWLLKMYDSVMDDDVHSNEGMVRPALCSQSMWDSAKRRCRMQLAPGGAICERHQANLTRCPRPWW